jgi:predicted AlkP superfamily pyrophosphatase or phosphodiesterase/uncharacterized membrane protein YvlD (DUF360 family)
MKNLESHDKPLSLKQRLFQFILSVVSLYIAIDIVDTVQVNDYFFVILAVLLIQFIQWIIQPFFGLLTKIFGIVGILFISLFGNALIVWLALHMLPEVNVENFWGSFLTAWLYALLTTVVNWVFVSQSDDVFLAQILRQNKNKISKTNDKPGFIFIQLDGVSAPILDGQIKAGNLPNITRLIRQDDYEFHAWHTQVPSTTPASQAGILFGNNEGIPAFRWYEKDTGKLIVANQTSGAHLIEKRLSNGNGLLSNGGVSLGNLFSGDAQTNIMVMSKVEGDRQSIKAIREYSAYFYSSLGFMRSLILSIAEMVKEVYQARRQISLGVSPRIKRHGSYILLRAMTNVLMRDLQTNIVIQNMLKGVNSLYVDYLDYDEVAHHAGMARPESLASLRGLDWVVGMIDRSRQYAPRKYELILVSDHGQSQGPTFKQLHNGKTLEMYINDFVHNTGTQNTDSKPAEEQKSILTFYKKNKKDNKSSKVNEDESDMLNTTDIVFTGSGNLGNIWFKNHKKRLTLEEIQNEYPDLIEKILQLDGVGMIVVKSKDGHLCISFIGSINLETKDITKNNPLNIYSKHDTNSLLRLSKMNNAPDIIVISSYDEITGEVYAFEELVGNHGGIGGWQTEAILLHPRKLKIDKKYLNEGDIVGAESVHKILKNWLDTAQK